MGWSRRLAVICSKQPLHLPTCQPACPPGCPPLLLQELAKLQAVLDEKDREVEDGQAALAAAQKAQAEKAREHAGQLGQTADKEVALGRELEAAKKEVEQIRREQEAERGRVKKVMADLKRKLDG